MGEKRLLPELAGRFQPEELARLVAPALAEQGASNVEVRGAEVTFTVPRPLLGCVLRRGFGGADAGALRFRGDVLGVTMSYRVRLRTLTLATVTVASAAALIATAVATAELGAVAGRLAGLGAFAGFTLLGAASAWINLTARFPRVFVRAVTRAAEALPPGSAVPLPPHVGDRRPSDLPPAQ
jgi:hypothetical protein